MGLRFRIWMPLAAVLIVLLSIALMFLYGVPAVRARLVDYAETRTFTQAAAAAEALSETEEEDFRQALSLSAETTDGEIFVVDTQGRVVARAGSVEGFEPSEELLQRASFGRRQSAQVGDFNVAVAPIVREGAFTGGVVFVSDEPEAAAYQLFLRSGIEAAGIASILGGGLMLLLGTLLSRRVERLALGARSIEGGDLSHRLDPGFRDELGELGETFNAMAARLQDSFALLEDRVAERTAQLEAERARLEAVLQQMPSGVIIAEAPSGRLILGNEQVERIWRRPFRSAANIEEYPDQYEIFHPDGRPYQLEERPLARSIRTGEVVTAEEIGFRRGDGTEGTISISSAPIRDRDGRIVAGVAILNDITERKRIEQEIRRLNEDLERRVEERTHQLERERATLDTILTNLAEGVLAADSRNRVVFANPTARSMLGFGGEEPLEKLPDPWEEFHLPEAAARCAQEQGQCMEARVQSEGTLLDIKLEHLPAFDDHRGGTLVVMQDLSEGRRLEVRQQRFLVNAAHELKTPITTILGASDLLLTEDEEDPEVRRRFLKHIFTEAHRMQRLSETLLRLARVGWDQREPDLQPLDLAAVAREVIYRIEPLAKSAGIELSLAGRGTRVRGDAEWLEQALLVVVNNAVKYSGGHVRLRLDGGTVAVEDDGAGISAEDLPHVFDRFYKGRDSSGGFGLGLPICKDLVERMGGKISIDSEEGVGTTVEIKLPEVQDG